MGRRTFSLLLTQAAYACFTLNGVKLTSKERFATQWSLLPTRDEGDLWYPPNEGCNRLPCGSYMNDITSTNRIQVHRDENLLIQAHIRNPWTRKEGVLKASLKYGQNPDFSHLPQGIEDLSDAINYREKDAKSPIVTLNFKLSKLNPRFNFNATIQVEFVTEGVLRTALPGDSAIEKLSPLPSVFYQCIDLEVTDGKEWTLGSNATVGFVSENSIGGGGEGFQPTPTHSIYKKVAAVIGTFALCGLIIAAIMLIMLCRKKPEPVSSEPIVPPVEQEPLPEPNEPTPPAQPEKEEEDPVIEIKFQDSQPPQPEAEEKQASMKGSEGRHFHFRYVEEGENE